MNNKYNLTQICKLLEKIFNAGFNNEKDILSIKLDDLPKISDLTSLEINIIKELKKANKNKKVIAFLNGNKREGGKNEEI